MPVNINNSNYKKATFAGGCFWCMEYAFEKVDGVKEVISGYSGGEKENPTYREVASGQTSHVEAIQVIYDSNKTNYKELLDIYWKQIDPTDNQGQFVDRGAQYRPIIFYNNESEEKLALESKKKIEESNRFDKPIVVEITEFRNFFVAEDYHQDYYRKNPLRYKYYSFNSGRNQFLDKVWKADVKNSTNLKNILTPIQYKVTQKNGTEKPFQNEYWDNYEQGIYVDIVSGEVLFSSNDKYDSETGWPSFTKPLNESNIIEKEDNKFFMKRTEVRSKNADSHLGHVFTDGPEPTELRYCINSAALKFISKENLVKEGYEEYLDDFN